MKYPDGWNKLGHLQKGLTSMLQFPSLLRHMRPSEEAGQSKHATVCIIAMSNTCVSQGKRLVISEMALHRVTMIMKLAPYIVSEFVTLILSRCIEIPTLDFSDMCCLSMKYEVRCKSACYLWKHLKFT